MSDFRSNRMKSSDSPRDQRPYDLLLKEASQTDLSRVTNSGCVTIGKDLQGLPVIAFIPNLNFDYSEKSEDTVRQIYLLFVLTAHPIISNGPFSLAYSRKSVDWRKPVIYEYYKILNEDMKRNLKNMYVINPQIGNRMFYTLARVFFSAEFYKKLIFCEDVADFQRIVPPKLLILPYNFLCAEDTERGLKCSGVSIPLLLDYVAQYGTTSIMKRCTTFLRSHGGLRKTGLFRVAGNENQLSLVRVRLQPPIFLSKDQMRQYAKSIIIGLDDEDLRSSERIGIPSSVSNKSIKKPVSDDDVAYHLSTVVINEVETVAQVR